MFSDLLLMLPPFVICLILTGIHGYLGIHVLERKVIFVDLAMAQIAALGATLAFALGYDPNLSEDSSTIYFFSLAFALLGAALFSLTRMRQEKVPQEAFIGIVYASASALAMLILSKSSAEGEHLKRMLVGNVLLVTWPTIVKTAVIYGVVGAFHWVFRGRFFGITLDSESALRKGVNVPLWDFLFYATFGIVITSSVAIAGVLLVFSFLVVPAAIAVLFARTLRWRIVLAWGAGTLVSLIGMLVSYHADLPTGPAVVVCFALVLSLAGVIRYLFVASHRPSAALRVATGVLVLSGVGTGVLHLRKATSVHEHAETFESLRSALRSGDEFRQIGALHHIEAHPDPHFLPEIQSLLEGRPSDRLLEQMVHVLPVFRNGAAPAVLKKVLEKDLDGFLRFEIAKALMELQDPSCLEILIGLLSEEESPLVREKADRLFVSATGQGFGYDPARPPAGNQAALQGILAWWEGHRDHLAWRDQRKRFE